MRLRTWRQVQPPSKVSLLVMGRINSIRRGEDGMADRLKGKVAIVTGAAPRGEGVGNGMATAIMFAREGAKVVLVNRSAERAEALAKQIAGEGGEAAVFAGDVTLNDAAQAMAEFAVKRYGRLDVLHNNVGVGG